MGFSNTYGGQYCLCIVTSRVFNTSMGTGMTQFDQVLLLKWVVGYFLNLNKVKGFKEFLIFVYVICQE